MRTMVQFDEEHAAPEESGLRFGYDLSFHKFALRHVR